MFPCGMGLHATLWHKEHCLILPSAASIDQGNIYITYVLHVREEIEGKCYKVKGNADYPPVYRQFTGVDKN